MIVTADGAAIDKAALILKSGGLVAFPTETVYGLGADATNGRAVAGIFEAKGRPRFNPLIVHVPNLESARDIADFPDKAHLLAERFWPGPLTLVLPLKEGSLSIHELVTSGLDTVAIRVPSHPVALRLLTAAGVPVAAPSANRSGHVSPTRAQHVQDDLGEALNMILDGGETDVGLESTIVGFFPAPALLRAGGLPRAWIEQTLGAALEARTAAKANAPRSSGQLESHYAPRARVRIAARDALVGEVLVGFGPQAPHSPWNLSRNGDLREAAANLFSMLRDIDATGAEAIAVMPIPNDGLGEAINDRLRRASAPRT